MQITHLTFADDLLFFSKGTQKSIVTLLDCFEKFSHTSGLVANRRISDIYFSGVSDARRREICRAVDLQEGSLPFRYLGIPLNAKRLSINQYQPLLEKMPGKLRHWTAKLLTYGGRLQLVQSVLYAVQNYWSQLFFFPKKVLKKIEAICRQFLWYGDVSGSKKSTSCLG